MKDPECIQFLQWALPQKDFRWRGFRKVRNQVCKRIQRRMDELELPGIDAYREYLQHHPGEWEKLDGFCRITISRFYRNRDIFEIIGKDLFPYLLGKKNTLTCWSVGCASGEEPYSLLLAFYHHCEPGEFFQNIRIVATDAEQIMLERAGKGCYSRSTLKELPGEWIDRAFIKKKDSYCIKEPYKQPIRFFRQDIRKETPNETFDLILCRNLVATYFDHALQQETFQRITYQLHENGFLIIGKNEMAENLPQTLKAWDQYKGIFQKIKNP